MTNTDDAGFELTSDQLEVVTSAWDTRQLVTAPAGAGKTTTLCRRIGHLIEQQGLKPAEILVLTFSRAAVRRLRTMLSRGAAASKARRVRVQTFDSWAYGLLADVGWSTEDLARSGFEGRIRLAAETIEDPDLESASRAVPRHVIIDEVQDLVGARRDMVEAILDRYSAVGFTVVGDPAQSIYGFQVSEPVERAEEVGRFFQWLRGTFSDELTERELTENFRTSAEEARVALSYGQGLRELVDNPDLARRSLLGEMRTALLTKVPALGSLSSEFVWQSLSGFDGTIAILCRDNAEVLAISEQLGRVGVSHRIQHASHGVAAAPVWIADLLNAATFGVIDQQRFEELLADTVTVSLDAVEVWELLRRVAGAPRNRLDLDLLRRATAERRLPDELTTWDDHGIVVSTVHRAKGLEFDRVLIVGMTDESPRVKDTDPADEARLLYVAMTRAREDMYRLEAPDTRLIRKGRRGPRPISRWFAGGYQHWVRTGIEITERDVCHLAPAGATTFMGDPIAIQKYLREVVCAWDEVVLRRLHDLPPGDDETPPYGIFHRGTFIGEVSQAFRHDLWCLLKQSSDFRVARWPCLVTGVRIDGLETVVGLQALTDRQGLGDRGVWLAPRLFGLGRFDWTHAEQVPEGHDHP